jgi:hypothetical protein
MPDKNTPLIHHREDEIAFIEINRPEKKNALNYECWRLFDKHFDDLHSDALTRALVITGLPENIFSLFSLTKFFYSIFLGWLTKQLRGIQYGKKKSGPPAT